MQCPECQGEMELIDVPRERGLFRVPFTDWEIRLTDWGHKEWHCIGCYTDKMEAREERIARPAYEVGFDRGYEAGQRDQR